MSKSAKINVIQSDEGETIAHNVIAQAILDMAKAMKALSTSRLKRETIVALIHDKSRITKGDIEIVLNNLSQLEETWLKKSGK